MKLEILLIALLCTVKATGKVNGDLLKIEEGGSGIENDTLINSIEKINGGSKKQIDTDTEASGTGDDNSDDPLTEISGSGDDEEDFSGSGGGEPSPVYSTRPPIDFEISTSRKNITSETVVLINVGSTVSAVTTESAVTDKTRIKEVTQSSTEIDNNVDNDVESTPRIPNDVSNKNVIVDKSTGLDEGDNDSGINFTVAIVVGVVVGAILSILIIVFLVYRLRKKDEGSYSLDEPSSAMLTADTDSPPPKGKGEYYA